MNEMPSTHQKRLAIDEQICALLFQRKELSAHTKDSPTDEMMKEWAQKYGLDDTYLAMIFSVIKSEKHYQSRVEPVGFRHYIPVLQSQEVGDRIYTISYVRQYENASVVQLLIDWDYEEDSYQDIRQRLNRNYLGLFIDHHYECQHKGASGSGGHVSNRYVVTPPLPNDIQGFSFIFTEYKDVFEEKPTGLTVTMHC
ncbi:hypothetical protein [Lysinibacillus fusiformis]|uniref:hypothetical protein n=1 Tax=Lysinibacillus fusiformis TaxID=28031 RepID=UPI00215A16D1|nr:hypothetical protein [Lysinibacillus fusiformis]MCR8852577.1 hypothetical protein [Lysinibacillus fusiformis]WKT79048.1 hypothetical protein QYY55_09660 [Lysinibacillus fusiformis]